MKIIPAIDILDGKVVRLRKGNYEDALFYETCIEEMIEQYISFGFDLIHIVDLNGAKGHYRNTKSLKNILKQSTIKVQIGGGIRSVSMIENLLKIGAERIILGTKAIIDPTFLNEVKNSVNPSNIVIAIDVYKEVLKYNGWEKSSPLNLYDFIEDTLEKGFSRFLCTDISKDGMMIGPGIDLYKKIKKFFPEIHLIASGGISTFGNLSELKMLTIPEAVVGKAIYEKKITLEEIVEWNLKN